MGSSRLRRLKRRTVEADLGTVLCMCVAVFGLIVFDVVTIAVTPPPDFSSTSSIAKPATLDMPTVLTLHYGKPWDMPYVLHNCVLAARVGVHMEFLPTHCRPPNATAGSVNHCEKLAFVAHAVPSLGEAIYLDSDVVVMREDFFARLAARARSADFLASYDPGYIRNPQYFGFLNSGVMFMRAIPSANFTDLMPRMYKYRTGYDQSIITGWVYDHYRSNWDTLSAKWHCRNLALYGYDIPPAECFTIHDRNEVFRLLQTLDYRLHDRP